MQSTHFYVKDSNQKGITGYSKTIFDTIHEKWLSANFIETMWPKVTLMTISYIPEH